MPPASLTRLPRACHHSTPRSRSDRFSQGLAGAGTPMQPPFGRGRPNLVASITAASSHTGPPPGRGAAMPGSSWVGPRGRFLDMVPSRERGHRDAVEDGRAARRRRTGRRRWMLTVTGLVLAGSATAGGLAVLDRDPGPDGDPATGPAPVALPAATPPVTATTTPPPPELPRGGRQLFPRYRVVGFYGMQNLDVLGAGPPDAVAQRLLKVARPYARPDRPVMPMFELIATIAPPFPTPSGLYRTHQEDAVVRSYLEAVRRIDGVLVLDVQPGREDFVGALRH